MLARCTVKCSGKVYVILLPYYNSGDCKQVRAVGADPHLACMQASCKALASSNLTALMLCRVRACCPVRCFRAGKSMCAPLRKAAHPHIPRLKKASQWRAVGSACPILLQMCSWLPASVITLQASSLSFGAGLHFYHMFWKDAKCQHHFHVIHVKSLSVLMLKAGTHELWLHISGVGALIVHLR